MDERDEDGLADEELSRMWEEGEPVPILDAGAEAEPPQLRRIRDSSRDGGTVRSRERPSQGER